MTAIDALHASARTVPTDAPEFDATVEWDSTTIVIVEAEGGGERGLGYTYGSAACAALVDEKLAPPVAGSGGFESPAAWAARRRAVRNDGQVGLTAMAIAAVDIALWDLAARLRDLPLSRLLGR